MKILMATMGLDIGGAETHIVELSKQLKQQGHDIAIISNGGVYVPEITAAGIRHYEAPLHLRNVGTMIKARGILKEVIAKENPDVVHAHARIPAFLCGTLHKSMKFPFVTTAHWVFTSKGALRYLTNWGERTVAVSDDIKAYLIREYGLPAEHISVTINGIDTEKFSPAVSGEEVISEFGLDKSRPILSYVSRMDEDRALVARQLIEIAPELDKRVPGVQLLIAGGGNVYDELLAKAKEVNAAMGRTCITMPGARTDINKIVAAGEVFVGVSRAALEAMAAADIADVEEYVRSCGFYKHKARDIVLGCQMLLTDYGGKVPGTMEELLRIPGVGRKTANLLLGDLYAVPGSVVCDTHCIRICGRLGLSHGKEPEKVEQQLRAILPPEESNDFCHRIVLFGRDCCTARNPKCDECPFSMYCREFNP